MSGLALKDPETKSIALKIEIEEFYPKHMVKEMLPFESILEQKNNANTANIAIPLTHMQKKEMNLLKISMIRSAIKTKSFSEAFRTNN